VKLPFRSTTRIERDGSVTSVQTLEIAGARLPERLDDLFRELPRAYTSWISRLTGGLVEIREEPGGTSRARVVPLGPTGLLLGPPRVANGAFEREILEGWLVAERSGTLGVRLEARERSVLASVELHGFKPRILTIPALGAWLFSRTQDAIHVRHSRGFLRTEVAPRLPRIGRS
jgi:hypothetical protein